MADLINRDHAAQAIEAYLCSQCDYDTERDPECIACPHLDGGEILKSVPSVNQWISFSEMFPNEAGEYLVCGRWSGERPKTWICQYLMFGGIGGFANPAGNPPVSFWMPMPDVYKPPEKE